MWTLTEGPAETAIGDELRMNPDHAFGASVGGMLGVVISPLSARMLVRLSTV